MLLALMGQEQSNSGLTTFLTSGIEDTIVSIECKDSCVRQNTSRASANFRKIQGSPALGGDDVGTAIAGYRTRYALHGSDNALLALVFEEVDCRLDFGPHRPWWELACS